VADTRQQEDTARRLAERARATVAHVRVLLGGCQVHEVRSAGIVIGREDGDVRVSDSRISRQHVQIERTPSGWQLIDLGSKNGGYVDGRMFKTRECAALGDGTVIRLGDSLFVFRMSPPPSDLRSEAPAFPGVSPAAADVRRRVDVLAAASGHALVLGETGTGKERVARAIAEPRKTLPFVTQNCGELSRELARSELFGHAAGAFSGATHSKAGLVELAGDGVLFLDEIGELSPDVQVDLLRFLEDGTYRPISAPKLQHSTARVIAATNLNLDHAVASGKFRRDLAARLRASNAPLELPPLRDRREDIPQWCRLFLREAGHAADGEFWTVGALECLLLYPWLGNLRELRGVVRALVADNVAPPCPTERLPERIYAHRNVLRAHASGVALEEATPPGREPTQAEIEDALRQTKGIVISAARLLGIERTKLYRLCREFRIELEGYRIPGLIGDD
jgi:DNA-binding NtrC family response regulator